MEKYDIDNSLLKNLKDKAQLQFDYEVNTSKIQDTENNLNSKMYYLDESTKSYRIINYNNYHDSLELPIINNTGKKIFYSNCLKRLVSKQKKRFQDENFDLDMAYITKRVIAIGYPSTGCESIYRNSLKDVVAFFQTFHSDNVKIYNLCIEKERIYDKNIFNGFKVGLFPSKDHNPCPLKLILDCCIDIVLYLIKYPNSVAAIHCKAGKGRTGVMICCYLIFSGICKSAEEAMEHYSEKRTYDKKGVTIPSQKRYIRYFESFLKTNYSFPYIYMIPKIIKYHLTTNMTNILNNFSQDSSYFYHQNSFYLNYFKFGPFDSEREATVEVCDFFYKKLDLKKIKKIPKKEGKEYYFIIDLLDKPEIKTDIKIISKGKECRFELWCNLWYSTLELLKLHIDNSFENYRNFKFNNEDLVNNILEENPTFIKKDSNNLFNDVASNDELNSDQRFMKLDYKKDFGVVQKGTGLNLNPSKTVLIDNLTNLFEIIEKVNNNRTDLNLLITNINKICLKENKNSFDRKELNLIIPGSQLDNCQNKSIKFKFVVNYSLV